MTNPSHPNAPGLVVVTPIFEDREVASRLFAELVETCGSGLYIVAVDDGSVREPIEPAALASAGANGAILRLKRNVGHQRAIAIGLGYINDVLSDTGCVVIMDSDGEDMPSTIVDLRSTLESGDVDVAVAQRRSRVESLKFRVFYTIYKRIFGLLTGRSISFGNFMAMKPAAARRLGAMQEVWTHVAASVLGSKLRIALCPLDRGPRFAGRSKMNFVGLVLHGFKALMVYAEDVLVRVGVMCAVVSTLSVLAAGVAVALKLTGYATPGWLSMALGVLFLVFLQTGALTLMTLMLSGVLRGGALAVNSYRDYIDRVILVQSRGA